MKILCHEESAIKYFRSLVESMGDQEMKSSFICISPLRNAVDLVNHLLFCCLEIVQVL